MPRTTKEIQLDVDQAPANIVRSIRIARGWSQTFLAEEIGCSQPTISRMESGVSPILPELAGVLAQVLGVQPSDLRPDLYPSRPQRGPEARHQGTAA